MQKVFVAMSGGVDSSVAAWLLKNEGYEVTGAFMRCYNLDGCSEKDAEDARRVAEKIGIPFYVWDFEEEYKRRVVDYMIEGYRRGTTPNPDVMCNKEIKFGIFFDRAMSMGAEYVATGHYVRLGSQENLTLLNHASRAPAARSLQSSVVGRRSAASAVRQTAGQAQPPASVSESKIFSLRTAKDTNKDQSYFLWTLTQDKLKHCLFPIGDYLKSEVREMARKTGLPTAEKKDSQGICFLGKVTLADFLKNHLPEKRGEVFDLAGNKVGEHVGAHFYTIGQRQGVGNLKHQKGNKIHTPVYVAAKNIHENTIVVAEGGDNKALYCNKVTLSNVNFMQGSRIKDQGLMISVLARVRYRQPLAKGKLEMRDEKLGATLIFDEPQKFVAPGQSAVFYLPAEASAKAGEVGNLEVLGGGVILEAG